MSVVNATGLAVAVVLVVLMVAALLFPERF
ncbi:potassium-transporting ATPase subunit F [Streptosporangium sandarakinum]